MEWLENTYMCNAHPILLIFNHIRAIFFESLDWSRRRRYFDFEFSSDSKTPYLFRILFSISSPFSSNFIQMSSLYIRRHFCGISQHFGDFWCLNIRSKPRGFQRSHSFEEKQQMTSDNHCPPENTRMYNV